MPSSAPIPTAPIRPANSGTPGLERGDYGARKDPVIKFIAAALWICAATLGAGFYSFQAAGERGRGEPPPQECRRDDPGNDQGLQATLIASPVSPPGWMPRLRKLMRHAAWRPR